MYAQTCSGAELIQNPLDHGRRDMADPGDPLNRFPSPDELDNGIALIHIKFCCFF